MIDSCCLGGRIAFFFVVGGFAHVPQAAVSWVAGSDPTNGMEYVTVPLLEEADPAKEKDLAKALLQERANVKDFICQVSCKERERARVIISNCSNITDFFLLRFFFINPIDFRQNTPRSLSLPTPACD